MLRHIVAAMLLLAAFLVLATFKPALRTLAIAAGLISVVSFLWLAWSVGGYNANLARVFNADLIALAALLIAAALHWRPSRSGAPA